MKYERQRHSQLFIALQERKKKIEKAATPYTLRGRVGIVFFHSCRGIAPNFTMCNVIAAAPESPYKLGRSSVIHRQKDAVAIRFL